MEGWERSAPSCKEDDEELTAQAGDLILYEEIHSSSIMRKTHGTSQGWEDEAYHSDKLKKNARES